MIRYVVKTESDIFRHWRMAVGGLFWDPWIVMLILGAVHSHQSIVPAFGYWVTFALVFALRVAHPDTSVLHPYKLKKIEPERTKPESLAELLRK